MYEDLENEILNQYKTVKQQREKLLETQMGASWDAFKGKYDSTNLDKWLKTEGTKWRSKVFVRLTKMKVVTAVATGEDILLQGGTLPWNIYPTEVVDILGLPEDVAKELVEARCENMRKKIKDTIQETHAVRPFIGAFQEKAIYGWSWLKFPVRRQLERLSYVPSLPNLAPGTNISNLNDEQKIEGMRYAEKVKKYYLPMVEHPSVWDVFWDLEGWNPQRGQCIIQRNDLTAGMLRQIVGEDSKIYLKQQIDETIKKLKSSATSTEHRNPYLDELESRTRNIVLLEYQGRVEKELLKKSGIQNAEIEKEGKEVEIITALAGDEEELHIIRKPTINTMPMKRRTLWISRWEQGLHEPGGTGIAENIKDSQQMVNSAVRLFIDNKALSGNLMIAGKSGALAPGVSKAVRPGKWFELAEQVSDVREALQWFSPPDIGAGILDVINLFERFADEESNLPKMLQGETAQYQPKTAFEFGKLLQASNKVIGKVIRNTDHEQIEPYISELYHYWMIASDDENIKGDYTCVATGFSSFMDKQVKGAQLLNMLTFALSNNILLLLTEVPDLWREVAKTQDMEQFIKDKDKIDQMGDQIVQFLQAQAVGGGAALPPPSPEQQGGMG